MADPIQNEVKLNIGFLDILLLLAAYRFADCIISLVSVLILRMIDDCCTFWAGLRTLDAVTQRERVDSTQTENNVDKTAAAKEDLATSARSVWRETMSGLGGIRRFIKLLYTNPPPPTRGLVSISEDFTVPSQILQSQSLDCPSQPQKPDPEQENIEDSMPCDNLVLPETDPTDIPALEITAANAPTTVTHTTETTLESITHPAVDNPKNAIPLLDIPCRELVAELGYQINKRINQAEDRLDRRVDEIQTRVDNIQELMNRVDNGFEEVIVRVNGVQTRINKVNERSNTFDDRINLVNDRLDRAHRRFEGIDTLIKDNHTQINVGFGMRVAQVDGRVDRVKTCMAEVEDRVDGRVDRVKTRMAEVEDRVDGVDRQINEILAQQNPPIYSTTES